VNKMFKCIKCNKEIDEESVGEKIRCIFCGFRIITKTRPKKAVKVKAI